MLEDSSKLISKKRQGRSASVNKSSQPGIIETLILTLLCFGIIPLVVSSIVQFFFSELSIIADGQYDLYLDNNFLKLSLSLVLSILISVWSINKFYSKYRINFISYAKLNVPNLTSVLYVLALIVPYMLTVGIAIALIKKYIPSFDADQTQESVRSLGLDFNPFNKYMAFISLALLTPIFEELIFRGLLYRNLASRINKYVAAVLVSIVFAVLHGQWNVIIDTFILSLFMIHVYSKYNNLTLAILMHSIKNAIATIALFYIV